MPPSALDFSSVEGALLRYRVVAMIVGISILVLVCIGLPLDKGAGHPGIDQSLGFVHGVIFYPVYVLLTLDLGRRIRMHPIQLILTIVFGTVPIVSFYAERRTTKLVRERQAALTHETV
jgi:integral membrane protein